MSLSEVRTANIKLDIMGEIRCKEENNSYLLLTKTDYIYLQKIYNNLHYIKLLTKFIMLIYKTFLYKLPYTK